METKMDNSNIEEAECFLRESGYLNYEVSDIFILPFLTYFCLSVIYKLICTHLTISCGLL